MRSFRLFFWGLPIVVLAAFVVACGPGNNGPVAGYIALAPTAPPLPALSIATVSNSFSASSAIGTAQALPSGGGVSGTLTLPAGTTGAAGTLEQNTLQSSTPAGLPVLQSLLRRTEGSRSPARENAAITPLFFLGLLFTPNTVTVPAPPTMTFTLPSGFLSTNGVAYYIALYDPTFPGAGWISRFMSCAAGTTTLTCSGTGSYTFVHDATYWFALYAISTNAPAPTNTTAPSVSPSTTANPNAVAVKAAPTVVTLPTENGVSGTLNVPAAAASPIAISALAGATIASIGLPALTNADVGTVLYAGSLGSAAAVSFSGSGGATFNVPTSQLPSGAAYYIAAYDPSQNGWYVRTVGPGVVGTATGSTTPITFTTGIPLSLKAGVTYGFALYATSTVANQSNYTLAATNSITLPASGSVASGTLSFGVEAGNVGQVIQAYAGASPPPAIPALPAGLNALYYLGINPSQPTAILSPATWAITVNGPFSSNYTVYGAAYDSGLSTGWVVGLPINGGGAPVNNQIQPSWTVASGVNSLTMGLGLAAHPYALAIYSVASPYPSASSTPTVSSGSSNAPIPLPSTGIGWSGTLAPGSVSITGAASTSFTLTTATTPLNGVAAPAPNAAQLYVFFSGAANNVALGGTQTLTLTAPAGSPSGTYYLDAWSSTSPNLGWAASVASATLTNGTLTFTYTQPLALQAGVNYALAVVR